MAGVVGPSSVAGLSMQLTTTVHYTEFRSIHYQSILPLPTLSIHSLLDLNSIYEGSDYVVGVRAIMLARPPESELDVFC